MYSKRNRLKRKKKDLSFGISAPVNTPLGIGLLAAPVVIPLIARVISSVYNKIRAHMNDRELMRQIQDGRLTERDLVQSFVNQFFSELPSKYVDLYRKQLRRLQTCNTFRELKRTYKEIGFANTVGMNTITKLESDYLRAVANRPKSISVNGAITHDSMPWAHIKRVNSSLIRHRDANNERAKKKIQQNIKLAEQSIKELERSDDSQLHVYLDKLKKKLKLIWEFTKTLALVTSVAAIPAVVVSVIPYLIDAIVNRINRRREEAAAQERFNAWRASNPRPTPSPSPTPRPTPSPAQTASELRSARNLSKAITGILSGVRELDLDDTPSTPSSNDIPYNRRYGSLDLDSMPIRRKK